jgi:hypothetical protein
MLAGSNLKGLGFRGRRRIEAQLDGTVRVPIGLQLETRTYGVREARQRRLAQAGIGLTASAPRWSS